MISPTMMMETEVDTDTETQEESDERNNIYEEVLNSDTCRRRHGRTKLAATSSIYRNSWWEGSASRYQVLMKKQLKHFTSCGYFFPLYTTCNFKSALFRTIT